MNNVCWRCRSWRERVDECDGAVGECLDHNLGHGTMWQCMMNGAIAIPDKTDATFNDGNMLRCWVENDCDVVSLHEFGEGFKFQIHMRVCDNKVGGVAQSKGLVKTFAQQWDVGQ